MTGRKEPYRAEIKIDPELQDFLGETAEELREVHRLLAEISKRLSELVEATRERVKAGLSVH